MTITFRHDGHTSAEPSREDAFAHGYVLVDRSDLVPAEAVAWTTTDLGPATLALHPRTRVRVAEARSADGGRVAAVVIGHPADVDHDERDVDAVTERAARELARGLDAMIEYVSALAGRFNVLAVEGTLVTAVPDTCATQSMYWSLRGGRFVLSTHVELVAAAVDAPVNEAGIRRVERLGSIRPGMTRFFAGIETPYDDVLPVIANCRLTWDSRRGTASHRRFYPLGRELRPADRDSVYASFREVFGATCRHLAGFGRTALSLTAGRDSRTTLYGALPHLGPDAFAFTYFNPGAGSDGHADDLFRANALAHEVGLPHRVVRWRRAQPGSLFDDVFSRTWRAMRPSEGAACAMYEDLPRGIFQLQSMHAEVSTVFYRRRNDSPPDARRLVELFQGPQAAQIDEYVHQFETFIDYAQFTPEHMGDFDYHDLFYWEHRDTRWAAQKPHEGDLGHRVLQPFNSRRLIETMHALPYEDRLAKVILERFIADAEGAPVAV